VDISVLSFSPRIPSQVGASDFREVPRAEVVPILFENLAQAEKHDKTPTNGLKNQEIYQENQLFKEEEGGVGRIGCH
jgi:hypothetical protein